MPKTPRRSSSRTARDPFRELAESGPRPVYAIDGEAKSLVDDFVAELKEVAVPPVARDFNLDSLVGKDTTLVRVLDLAQTLPAFSERRMVLVRQADKILNDPEPLLRYLESPSPTTVLAFVADKFDGRSKVYKALQKAGAAVRFTAPKPREMPGWIRARADRIGLRMEPEAIRMLAEAVGTDLGAASRALELVELYRGPKVSRPITADDVAAVVLTGKEESIFDLVDAIGARNVGGALVLLHRISVEQREPALRVLALIARHYRQLLVVRELVDQRASSGEMASALGLPPFVVDKLRQQAAKASMRGLVRGHAAIKAVDRQLKGGRLTDVRALEGLALQLMSA